MKLEVKITRDINLLKDIFMKLCHNFLLFIQQRSPKKLTSDQRLGMF